MSDNITDYNDPLEYIENKYRVSSEDSDVIEYSPDGADEIELAYKMRIAEIRAGDIDIDTNYDIEIITLHRIYNEIADQIERREEFRQQLIEEHGSLPDDGNEALNALFRIEVADSILLYYTLANEIIRGMAAELLSEQVFVPREEEATFARNLNHSTLAKFLYHTELADKKLKDEIINANQTRNRVVHEFTSRHYLDGISNVVSMVDRTNYVIDELHDILYERRPFST